MAAPAEAEPAATTSEPQPRIRVNETASAGQVLLVRALITHPMETGLRHTADGTPIPRRIIHRFVCRYDGEEVFGAEFHEAVSANPYLEFEILARGSGTLEFLWYEDGGAIYRATRPLVVS